jgi:hypothetical protein
MTERKEIKRDGKESVRKERREKYGTLYNK